MRATLCEVIGEDEGRKMYSLPWLEERVRWHLDPENCTGQVFLAESAKGEISGHTIVRIETDEAGGRFGLFSTVYVAADARKQSVATVLLCRGEAWMRTHGLDKAATYTAVDNAKLIALFEKHGYTLSASPREDMVILSRTIDEQAPSPPTATSP